MIYVRRYCLSCSLLQPRLSHLNVSCITWHLDHAYTWSLERLGQPLHPVICRQSPASYICEDYSPFWTQSYTTSGRDLSSYKAWYPQHKIPRTPKDAVSRTLLRTSAKCLTSGAEYGTTTDGSLAVKNIGHKTCIPKTASQEARLDDHSQKLLLQVNFTSAEWD